MSSSVDPPFTLIAIAGIGLIGGSIALAVRERWPSVRVVAVDRAPVLAHALGSGAIDRGAETLAGIGDADLIVLAAPVRENMELLQEIARRQAAPAVVTDVGGTKQDIVRAARCLAPPVTFIGGHPIGGAERGGFAFARPDLFTDRPWIFTPGAAGAHEIPDVSPGERDALQRLFRFVKGLGARPSVMDAGHHDRLMAFLSHLPQLTATALMEVAGSAAMPDGLRLAGRGLVDTTRLAASPANVWRDICVTNAESIGEALDLLIARLTELRADLPGGDRVATIFEEAARWRAELMKGRD